jgi:hypothetical protein
MSSDAVSPWVRRRDVHLIGALIGPGNGMDTGKLNISCLCRE